MTTNKSIDAYIVPYVPRGNELGTEELSAVKRVIEKGKTLSCGSERDHFEREFADYIGVKCAKTTTNCTTALEFATHLLQFEPGDEVITTPMTYHATAASLLTQPVRVNFCDIDRNSLSISAEDLKKKISSKTKAIYLTHYGGLMGPIHEIMETANDNGIVVVADCAHANGCEINGQKAGAIEHIGCFSFQSYKNMTTLGEGGMITFSNYLWASTIDRIRAIEPDAAFVKKNITFGEYTKPDDQINYHDKNSYTHECLGIKHGGTNSTLSEVACAVGRVQLTKIDLFNERRRVIADRLNEELSKHKGIRIQIVPHGYKHVYHLYTFFVEDACKIDRKTFVKKLTENGIEIVLRYFPNHLLPEWIYKGSRFGDCPVAEDIWFNRMINLPIYPQLTDSQVDHMIWIINRILKP